MFEVDENGAIKLFNLVNNLVNDLVAILSKQSDVVSVTTQFVRKRYGTCLDSKITYTIGAEIKAKYEYIWGGSPDSVLKEEGYIESIIKLNPAKVPSSIGGPFDISGFSVKWPDYILQGKISSGGLDELKERKDEVEKDLVTYFKSLGVLGDKEPYDAPFISEERYSKPKSK